jgi:hypothetical protein
VEVESRLGAKEMIVVWRLQMMENSLLLSMLHCSNGRLELGLAFWGFQRRTGGYE